MIPHKKNELKQKLDQARSELTALLTSLTNAQWRTPVISEGDTWTPLDVAAHLAENERAMSIHIYKTRQGRETVPESFKVDDWNAGLKGRIGAPTPTEALQNLAQARVKTLEGLETINDEEWGLKGRHPVQGLITIEDYYHVIASHDLSHLNDIKQGLGIE
jgi:hypothetical protein